jgi:hypothetical protein
MTSIHDAVKGEIDSFRTEAGIRGGMEFRVNNKLDQRDGDVAFLSRVMDDGADFPHSKLAVDIQISCPTSAHVVKGAEGAVNKSSTQPSLQYSKAHKLLAGKAGYKSKMAKATVDRCAAAGFDFIGLSFETTGAIHPAAHAFLSSLANRASERMQHWGYLKPKLILGNWLNRLSFVIRKAHAEAILDRLTALNAFAVGKLFPDTKRAVRFRRHIAQF